MSQMVIIRADGTETTEPFPKVWDGDRETSKKLREIIGGWIEYVHVLYKDKPTYMVVNEEGALMQLPVNLKATEIYHEATRRRTGMSKRAAMGSLAWIYGDVVVLEGVKVI